MIPKSIIYVVLTALLLFEGFKECKGNRGSSNLLKSLLSRIQRPGTLSGELTAQLNRLILKLFAQGLPSNSEQSVEHHKTIKPLEQIIQEASGETGLFMADTKGERTIVFDGDIMMTAQQFNDLRRNIALDFLDAEAEKVLNRQRTLISLVTLLSLIRRNGHKRKGRQLSTNYPSNYLSHLKYPNNYGRYKRAAIKDESSYWPNGIVPIRAASTNFTSRDKEIFEQAMNKISELMCICFEVIDEDQAKTQKINHVRLVNGRGCSSYVGVSLHEENGLTFQDVLFGPKCRTKRVVMHELLHVLGLFHEHARKDREKYIKINFDNILDSTKHNFYKLGPRSLDSRGVEYDYLSIMHYSSRAFTKNGRVTIDPIPASNKAKYINKMGRVQTISKRDAEVINLMYKCPNYRGPPTCKQYPYKMP